VLASVSHNGNGGGAAAAAGGAGGAGGTGWMFIFFSPKTEFLIFKVSLFQS